MLSQQKAQTGARVYMGARMSPNRGQVSRSGANGYIQRELRNKARSGVITPVGRDGKSDNRSAVAAMALRRQGDKQQYQNQGRRNGGKQPFQNGGRQPGGSGGKQPFQNQGRPNGNSPQDNPSPSQLIINDQGILELPYNQDFSAAQFQAFADANDKLLDLKAGADQQNLLYSQTKRDNEQAYKALQAQTLNRSAASGTAFSSAYGTAYTNNASGHANDQSKLDAENTAFTQNLAMQRAAIQAALNQQLGLSTQQYGNQLNDLAGTLGYGTGTGQGKKRKKKRDRR